MKDMIFGKNEILAASVISRSFESGDEDVIALDRIDLVFQSGTYVALCGPSGCGKSTLLNILGLLDEPSSGVLTLFGRPLNGFDHWDRAKLRREHFGYLFQDGGMIERLSVEENIAAPMLYRGINRGRFEARLDDLLNLFGLASKKRKSVSQLSMGERQRVGLARATIARPAIIVCDEPTASLDEYNSNIVSDYLRSLALDGVLVICATHDPIVYDKCDIVIRMSSGRII